MLLIYLVFGTIISLQAIAWLISVYYRDRIIRHYQYQAGFMILSAIAAISVLDESFITQIGFVYFNTSNNTYDEGIIQAKGGYFSTTVAVLSTLVITTHQFLYSSYRPFFAGKNIKVKYDLGIKWIEYTISSSLQKAILYRVYGQVAQAIICVSGLNAACMAVAYFIENKIITYINRMGNTVEHFKAKKKSDLYKPLNTNKQNTLDMTIGTKISSTNKLKDDTIEEDEGEGGKGANSTRKKEEIEIYIRMSTEKKIRIFCEANKTVKKLKKRIRSMEGINVKTTKLFFAGKELKDGDELKKYNIENDSMIFLIEEDIISYYFLKYPRWIIFLSFVFYFLFIYGPLFVYDDDRPAWVQVFLVGMILNDLSFPLIMMIKLYDLDSINTDILFSSASLNSKNTMDFILILATKRVSSGVIIAMLPLSFLISYIIYKRSPNYSTNGIYVLKNPWPSDSRYCCSSYG